jgi:dynein heavy chain
MNPGYAGRVALPDNLVALFRPVAMMVPDYALIGKIMLYSFGYKSAELLALKMVTTFKLASEQLSSQCHYDYGMRAVRSVINAAGRLITEATVIDENKLLLRALLDVNMPKFLNFDLPLFANIIMDLFPTTDKPVIDYGALADQINVSIKHQKIIEVPIFIEKVIQLYDTIQVRHGLMLVGPAGGGKTQNIRVLSHAISALQDHPSDPEKTFNKTIPHTLNPKSITYSQLYGDIDPGSGEWDNGIAQKIVEEAAMD